ncbi:ABC transporter permease [Balneolaceae bacterium ANBcel3]|nr:ABC transporter permease [Balneolaceae bacterium ANBcel3]
MNAVQQEQSEPGKARAVLQVAKWEFNRFFKIKSMISSVVWTLVFMVIGGGVGYWLAASSDETFQIAVVDYGPIHQDSLYHETAQFHNRTEVPFDSLLASLQQREIHAVLSVDSPDEARIWTQGEPGWVQVLQLRLDELRSDFKIRQYDLTEEAHADIIAPMALERINTRETVVSRADKVLAGVAISLVLMAVFLGFAYQFTAITGEKQQRITEQIVSAIHPQAWIDGKILGISAIGLANILVYGILGLFVSMMLYLVFGTVFPNVLLMINPMLLIVFLSMSVLGVLMWNSFLAAVAATIDDPNSSERSALMLLPTLPVLFAFFALFHPDSTAISIMGWFPLTSFAVMPARMVLTEVAVWEVLVALILLVAVVWLFRRLAGRIFAFSMMIHGKEPGMKEMVHWFKRAE